MRATSAHSRSSGSQAAETACCHFDSSSCSPSFAMSETTITCVELPAGSTAPLNPALNQKVVFLVRHGQATHNRKSSTSLFSLSGRRSSRLSHTDVQHLISNSAQPTRQSRNKVFAATKHKEGQPCQCFSRQKGCPYTNEIHTDAKLTQRGRLQAAAAGASLLLTKPLPQFAFVSPLSRTLETASIALSKAAALKIPLVAEETIRERNGVHVCDKRSAKEDIMLLFPSVDFGAIPPGPDTLFSEVRETEDELAARGKTFFLSLKDRPEKSFVVFTHSSFLYNTLTRAFETPDDYGKQQLHFLPACPNLCCISLSDNPFS